MSSIKCARRSSSTVIPDVRRARNPKVSGVRALLIYSNFRSNVITSHHGTAPLSSLPDLIRQPMFPSKLVVGMDPRIKSGGDELGDDE